MIPENVQISKLANGLTLITIDQPWSKGIYCYSLVKVGSCDEQLEKDKGICHLLEHMVFRGTENYTKDQINQLIVGRGGTINAETSEAYTLYHMWSQVEFLEDSLSVMENLVFKPLIKTEHLNLEKNVVIEEILEYESNPFHKAIQASIEPLFYNNNYRFPICGTSNSVNSITSTRIKEYLRGYYRPQTIVLVLCGALPEPSKLEDILYKKAHGFVRKTRGSNSSVLKRNFGDINFNKNNFENEETWDDLKSSTAVITIPYIAEDFSKQDRVALSVLFNMIGGYINSMMFKQIRDDSGLCYNCGCLNDVTIDHLGSLSFYLLGRKENIQKANEKIEKIIKQVCDGKFNENDLSESKNHIIGSMIRGLENGGVIAKMMAMSFIRDENREKYCSYPWEIDSMIKKVNKKQTLEIANNILKNNKSKYIIYNK